MPTNWNDRGMALGNNGELEEALELLTYIWDNQPPSSVFCWWWDFPINKWLNRITITVVMLLFLCLLVLLLLHPCISRKFPSLKLNWTLYLIMMAFLLAVMFYPKLRNFTVKGMDMEVNMELKAPPSIEPVFSSMQMEQLLRTCYKLNNRNNPKG